MSLNVGNIVICVRDGVTQDTIAEQIAVYWLGKGAELHVCDPLELQPLSLEEDAEGRLAYAISPPVKKGLLFGKRWIAIAESERYNIDWGLAHHLATQLHAEVCWYTMYGATDGAEIRIINSDLDPPELPDEDDEDVDETPYDVVEDFVNKHFPVTFVYFNQLDQQFADARQTFRFVAFKSVSYDQYQTGPDEGDDVEAEA